MQTLHNNLYFDILLEVLFPDNEQMKGDYFTIAAFIWIIILLKIKSSSGHAIALWKEQCGIYQKKLIIFMIPGGCFTKILSWTYL